MPVSLSVTTVIECRHSNGWKRDYKHTHTRTHTQMQMHTHLCIHQGIGGSGLLMIRVIQVVVTAARNEGGAAKDTGTTTVLNRGNVLYQEKCVFVWINEEIKMGQ